MGKKSKEKQHGDGLEEEVKNITLEEPEITYEDKLRFVNAIAKPMATRSQAKKLFKLLKKAAKNKANFGSGLKDVQRKIRRGERGLCVFAGNVSPVDLMVHMPAVCEDKGIPYCYVPSRADLGAAIGLKRGVVMVIVRPNESYKELYDEMFSELQSMPILVESGFEIPQGKM